MTTIEFKGKTIEVKKLSWKSWMELLKLRKEGLDKDDDYTINVAIEKGILEGTSLTKNELDKLDSDDVYDLVMKLRDARSLPLQPNKESVEQSSQATPT